MRLQGYHKDRGQPFSCASMVYVSEDANGFYLSCEAMIDLAIVPPSFPSVGAAANDLEQQLHGHKVTDNYRSLNAGCSEPSSNPKSPCTCPVRTIVPYRQRRWAVLYIVYNKCSQLMGWILRTFISRERTVMLLLFKSLVLSRVDNGSQLWSPHLKQRVTYMFNREDSALFHKTHRWNERLVISREIMCFEVVLMSHCRDVEIDTL